MKELEGIIDLSDNIKELYTRYDYEFFLKRNLERGSYSPEDIAEVYTSYQNVKSGLKKEIKQNRRQMYFLIEGRIKKLHAQGILPMRFKLSERRSGGILNFEAEGESWAYFDLWKRNEKKKLLRKRLWDVTIKIGALLGFALTIMKILDTLTS